LKRKDMQYKSATQQAMQSVALAGLITSI